LAGTPPVFPCCLHYFSHFKSSIRGIIRRTTVLIFALHQLAPSVGKRFVFSQFVSLPEELRTVDSNSFSLMEAGDTSAQHLSASESVITSFLPTGFSRMSARKTGQLGPSQHDPTKPRHIKYSQEEGSGRVFQGLTKFD
jgi:hypothetical protein